MIRDGTIDQAAYGKLPKATGEPVSLTEGQSTKAKEYLSTNWTKAIS